MKTERLILMRTNNKLGIRPIDFAVLPIIVMGIMFAKPVKAAEAPIQIISDETAEISYVRGVPQANRSVGQNFVSFTISHDGTGRPAFILMITNGTERPFNVSHDDFAFTYADGSPIQSYTTEDLEKKAKSTAFWSSVAASLAASAGNTNYATTTVHTPYGTSTVHSSWTDQRAANDDMRMYGAAIAERNAQRSAEINDVLTLETIHPGETVGRMLVTNKTRMAQHGGAIIMTGKIDGVPFSFTIKR